MSVSTALGAPAPTPLALPCHAMTFHIPHHPLLTHYRRRSGSDDAQSASRQRVYSVELQRRGPISNRAEVDRQHEIEALKQHIIDMGIDRAELVLKLRQQTLLAESRVTELEQMRIDCDRSEGQQQAVESPDTPRDAHSAQQQFMRVLLSQPHGVAAHEPASSLCETDCASPSSAAFKRQSSSDAVATSSGKALPYWPAEYWGKIESLEENLSIAIELRAAADLAAEETQAMQQRRIAELEVQLKTAIASIDTNTATIEGLCKLIESSEASCQELRDALREAKEQHASLQADAAMCNELTLRIASLEAEVIVKQEALALQAAKNAAMEHDMGMQQAARAEAARVVEAEQDALKRRFSELEIRLQDANFQMQETSDTASLFEKQLQKGSEVQQAYSAKMAAITDELHVSNSWRQDLMMRLTSIERELNTSIELKDAAAAAAASEHARVQRRVAEVEDLLRDANTVLKNKMAEVESLKAGESVKGNELALKIACLEDDARRCEVMRAEAAQWRLRVEELERRLHDGESKEQTLIREMEGLRESQDAAAAAAASEHARVQRRVAEVEDLLRDAPTLC